MWQHFNTLLRYADGWNTQEWLVVFAIVVGVGVFALRGFGSRSSY